VNGTPGANACCLFLVVGMAWYYGLLSEVRYWIPVQGSLLGKGHKNTEVGREGGGRGEVKSKLSENPQTRQNTNKQEYKSPATIVSKILAKIH
jgi:hypothetical protein